MRNRLLDGGKSLFVGWKAQGIFFRHDVVADPDGEFAARAL